MCVCVCVYMYVVCVCSSEILCWFVAPPQNALELLRHLVAFRFQNVVHISSYLALHFVAPFPVSMKQI